MMGNVLQIEDTTLQGVHELTEYYMSNDNNALKHFVKLKVLKLQHTSSINDSRIIDKPILTLKYDSRVPRPKAFVVEGEDFDFLKSRTEKYISQSIGCSVDLFQVEDFGSNHPQIENLSADEKEKYAFSLIKLGNKELLARQLDPKIDLEVTIKYDSNYIIETTTFNLIKGKVADFNSTQRVVKKKAPVPQPNLQSELATSNSSTLRVATKNKSKRSSRNRSKYSRSDYPSFLETIKDMWINISNTVEEMVYTIKALFR
ncbi:MAG: hypothetical protein HDS60_05195 [Barnesiella sp.]|nr:hypothetical protein [Barnesiella sp.]